MRIIVIVLALLIVALLYKQQLTQTSAQDAINMKEGAADTVPVVPTNPQGVKAFEKQMNDYMKNEFEKRENMLDETAQ